MRGYVETLNRRDTLTGALERFFGEFDALLLPVSAVPAIPHCPGGAPVDVDGQPADYVLALSGHCMLFNATGHPAAVIPLTRDRHGLPIGLQLVGRLWGEADLLATAAQLAEVIGPAPHPPGC